MGERLRGYWEAASLMLGYAGLGVLWAMIFRVFLGHMLPRVQGILAGAPLANTAPCDGVQCDFSVFWPAGLLARHGQLAAIYNPHAFNQIRQALLFPGEFPLDWYYPPPSLLPLMPVSYLPIGPGFLVWVAGLTMLAALALRGARVSWSVILVSILSPASLWCIEMGQWDVFCGALLVAGLLLQARRPARGGLVLSLLLLKPQAALAMPVALLAGGRWRVIGWGVAGGAVLCGLTTLVLGPVVWGAWLHDGLSTAHNNLTAGHAIGLEESVSVFWALRNAGSSINEAYAGQIVAGIMAVAITAYAWRSNRFSSEDRVAITVIGSTLMAPYLFMVDLIAYEIALALHAERRGWRIGVFDAFLWLWPMLSPALYLWKGWLISPLVMILAILRFWLPPLLARRAG